VELGGVLFCPGPLAEIMRWSPRRGPTKRTTKGDRDDYLLFKRGGDSRLSFLPKRDEGRRETTSGVKPLDALFLATSRPTNRTLADGGKGYSGQYGPKRGEDLPKFIRNTVLKNKGGGISEFYEQLDEAFVDSTVLFRDVWTFPDIEEA